MVAWWWIPIAWVVGALTELMTVMICMGGNSKKEEREQLVKAGLLYPENKKAADAATSTADRETVRKDFFL